MNQRIIYPNDDGGVSIIIPAAECGLSIEQIAAKDVPAGKPYKIILASDLPDRSQRNAWTVNSADLTDGIGSASNEFGV